MAIVNWERYPTAPMRRYRKIERLCEFMGIGWPDLNHRFPRAGTALSVK